MAQHDYNLANQSGADFRADLNNALSAIATVNSGATEPSTTFAHQLWVDTSSNVLKIRNAANNDWITTGVSITASNTFTGNITGNADTATTLATARTINGVSFDGSANISFDTDSVSEGSSNLYFTNERVDDQVNTLLQAGTGIQLTYDDTAGTLTIANTNDADITGVVAGNGLTGGGTAGTVTLNVAVDDSSIEIDSDALRVKALGITNAMLAGSIANAKLSNSSVTINSNSLSLGGTLTLDTDDISEGSSNLYYTQARFDSAFTAKSTSDLSEGSNLYFTNARARAAISEDSTQLSYNSTTGVLTYTQGDTDTVGEGSSNLYYTQARFDSAFSAKTTADLTENTNLYYTDTRANSAIDARVTKAFVDALNIQAASVDANSVALGTDTTGNYIQTITGTANKITVTGSGSESADVTLTLPDDVQIADSLTVAGNLTVNGTLTSLDTTNLDIEDNLFQLNAGLTGSPVNDSGMLINRGSSDNGIFMWDESVDKFTLGLTTADGTSTGNITLSSLGTLVANIEGNVTGTIQTAAQPNITSLGTLTTLTVDNITIDGTEIDSNTDLTIDAAGDIALDADGGDFRFKDAGTTIATYSNVGGDWYITANSEDKDIVFQGNDGGSTVQALKLDMSAAGAATFNAGATFGSDIDVTGTVVADGLTSSGNILLDGSGNPVITNKTSGAGNNPVYRLQADTNYWDLQATFSNTNDDLYFMYNGSVKAGITSAGNFGIGTTSPSQKLHVYGGSILVDNGSSAGTIYFHDTTNYINLSGDSLQFANNGAERMRIDSSGRLGIGTSSPSSILHLSTSNDPKITLTDTGFGASADITGSNGNLRLNSQTATLFDMADSEVMRINSAGGLGIGTTAGTGYQLDITGQSGYDDILRLTAVGTNIGARINLTNTGTGVARINATNNSLALQTGGTERMRIDSSGKVGIGMTSPLSVASGYGALTVGGSTGGGIIFSNTSSGHGQVYANSSQLTVDAFSTRNLTFQTNGSERMRIDSSGNVGIGLTSPNEKLVVSGNASITGALQITSNTSAPSAGAAIFRPASNTLAFVSNSAERARIDSSGNLLVGRTSTLGGSTDDYMTVANVNAGRGGIRIGNSSGSSNTTCMRFQNSNGVVGAIRTSGSATFYDTSSDARLKDVTGEARGLEVINELNPVAYNWKADGKADEGLIAQEVLDVVPNAVSQNEDEYYQMDYSKLVTPLIKAVQELSNEVNELKQEIQNLKGE